jgi:hypothetical protein
LEGEVDFLIIEEIPNDGFSFIMRRIKMDEVKDSLKEIGKN